MTERNVGRPWTAEEDALLKEAVEIHGEIDNWKTIALSVPGRSNKACRKRWLHSLSPTVKKSAWTTAEDQKLLECYKALGPRWSAIARQIPGRTDDACSKRYREALDPTLKKDEWIPEEDAKLVEAYARIGGRWGQVGQELNRSGLACRNRWRLLERKKSAMLARQKEAATYDHIYSPEVQSQQQEVEYASFSPTRPTESVLWETYYYPDEAYAFMETEESTQTHISPELAPQHLIPPDIHSHTPIAVISTFSSLENALSDPPPAPRPLPSIASSINVSNTPGTSSELVTPITMSPPQSIVGLMDSQMTLADHSQYASPTMFHNETQLSPHPSDSNQALSYFHETNDSVDFGNPDIYVHDPSHVPVSVDTGQSPENAWKSPFTSEIELLSRTLPAILGETIPEGTRPGDALSSDATTPLGHISPVSQTPSPHLVSSADLPTIGTYPANPPAESLLFSSSTSHTSNPSQQATRKKKSPIQVRRILEDTRPHRLSSRLRLTADSSVVPYACGYDQCWPADANSSSSCFGTSKELSEHSKVHGDEISERPFRCGLSGCGKSWKSINGLQYHLQISTAHYRQALSSRFSSSITGGGEAPETEVSDGEGSDKKSRKYVCQHPGCFKAYRQLSGLRYHRKHGHPQDMPAQLEVVPPTLAAQLPAKTKKMRRKDFTVQASR